MARSNIGSPTDRAIPGQGVDVNSLGAGQVFCDQFVYAIRLGNGTLSEATVKINITGANDAVVLGPVTDASITDTAANDVFPNITGTLTSTDPDIGDVPTYGVDGSAASVEPGFDLQKVTAYGTLYLNSSTGAYKFVADNAAIQALDSDDPNVLLDFDVSVTDGDTTDSDTLTITIDGANDAVELAAVTDATINDTAADDTFADVTGSLVGSDRDAGETLTYDLDGSAASVEPGFDLQKVTAYGTLYLNSSTGAYKFVADNAAIQALDSDDPNVLLDFDVSVTDGDTTDSDTLTITIDGANDAVELAAVTDATINDTAADDTFPDVTGSLVGSDRDAGETLTYDVDGSAASVEPGFDLQKVTAYGTLYLNSSTGAYKFVADNAAIQALDSDDPNVLLDFDVSVTDGDTTDSDTLTITIDGANDAVELAAVTDATINDTAADDTFADVTGSLVGSDRDAGETLSYDVVGSAASVEPGFDLQKVTAYGTLYLNSSTGAYKFVADNAAIQALDSDDPNVLLDFDVSVTDGDTTDSDTLTITIDGANDGPVSGGPDSASGTEDDASIGDSVPVATDIDGDALTYQLVTGSVKINGVAAADGTVTLNPDGSYSYAPTLADQGLDTGEAKVITFDYVANDGTANSAAATVTITVNGVNDAPVTGGVASASGTENDASIGGSVPAATDVDVEPLTYQLVAGSVTINGVAAADGTITLNANGSYSYAPILADQGLDTGESKIITFDYVANDGTANSAAATVTITVNGVNDAPVITSNGGGATASISVAENTTAVTTVVATDVDVENITYSIVGGADSAKFTIDPNTGALSFVNAPDFENPTDVAGGSSVAGNNVYDVIVRASDGTASDDQAIAVTVTNVAEGIAPVAVTTSGSSRIRGPGGTITSEWVSTMIRMSMDRPCTYRRGRSAAVAHCQFHRRALVGSRHRWGGGRQLHLHLHTDRWSC